MAVLVTRPQPDNETTAAALRARGVEVLLAPALRFEPVPLPEGLRLTTTPSSSPRPMRCARSRRG
jgi:uroporphyrinogen-III synthase